MEAITFKIEDFEGPLDLLLYLVGKNKMNIYDIAILDLIDQYTALINGLGDERMEAASEFIEMAARLVQMKSYLLLPRSEEAERMKEELTGQLIEYEACKWVAGELGRMAGDTWVAVRRPMELPPDNTYRMLHDVSLLQKAWDSLMGRAQKKLPPAQERFEPLVTAPFVSVASRVVHVLRSLLTGKVLRLGQLFSARDSRSQTVATFLAVLELVRGGRITIDEDEHLNIAKRQHASVRKGNAHGSEAM